MRRTAHYLLACLMGIVLMLGDAVSGHTASQNDDATQSVQQPSPHRSTPDEHETLSGGAGTVFATSRQAFDQPIPRLSPEQDTQFFVGNSFFNRNWVIAPASTTARDGLGPLYNARSCSACHLRDGRGRPPATPAESMLSMPLRLSIPGHDPQQGIVPEPNYGGQLNGLSVPGVPAEGIAVITYEEIPSTFVAGERYSLRQPTYSITELNYGPLHPETRLSPRVAPFIIGLGLLEAVPVTTLLALADPHDRDSDGISGRPNQVWDKATQQTVLGRFGWKANQPTVAQQVAGAFLGDIGITSSLFPHENCTAVQQACQQAPHDGHPELPADLLDQVVFYSRTLAVPARRDIDDPEVQHGKQVFEQTQCGRCHLPTLRTGMVPDLPTLSEQTIHPYTDLLLHDMGEGLADGRRDVDATGREWRTAPLWGIGMVHKVNGHTNFMHDGRARNLTEAILWHGGEAAASKDIFRHMPRPDRKALLRFLESL